MRRLVSRKEALAKAASMRCEIYALLDPRDLRVRYVGRARECRKRRLKQHLAAAATEGSAAGRWLRELVMLGRLPVCVLLERTVGAPAAVAAEQRWHAEGLRLGWPLLNRQRPSGSGLGLGQKARGRQWTLADLGLDPSQPWMADDETRAALESLS